MALLLNANDTVSRSYSYTIPSPNHVSDVQSVGDYDSETGMYKIPVMTRGKNLFDYNAEHTDNIQTKAYTISNLDANKYYTCSTSFEKIAGKNLASIYFAGVSSTSNGVWKDTPRTFKPNTNGVINIYIRHIAVEGAPAILDKVISGEITIMVEEGTTATPYEPYHEPITTPIYLPTPLYSGEVLRSDGSRDVKWKRLVLTGKETVSKNNNESTNYLYYMPISTNKKINGYCSHLISRNGPPISVIGFNTNSPFSVIYFNFGADIMNAQPSGNTIGGFKQYLAAQYAAGTPVTVWYQLVKPTTETFTAPQIPTINGTTVIDVDTAVKPTEMYTKYKSSK